MNLCRVSSSAGFQLTDEVPLASLVVMRLLRIASAVAFAAGLVVAASPAPAASLNDNTFGYRPSVPVSAFARPMGLLNPSRLSISTSMSYGTWGHGQSGGLSVTSLRYQFGAPLSVQVNLGTAMGPGTSSNNAFFLEGLDLNWRPSAGTWFSIHYQDLRSPLQRQHYWGPYWGY